MFERGRLGELTRPRAPVQIAPHRIRAIAGQPLTTSLRHARGSRPSDRRTPHDRRLLANTIDAAGVRSITRRFLLGLAWIGGGTLLGALMPLLGVAMFASFMIFFWLPISGEIGAARPSPAQVGVGALARVPSSEPQPRTDHPAPGE